MGFLLEEKAKMGCKGKCEWSVVLEGGAPREGKGLDCTSLFDLGAPCILEL